MAYDEDLADRLRAALQDRDDVTEQRMFGGLAFLVGGRLAVAASRHDGGRTLMLRCDPAETDQHVAAGAGRMVMRGREMDGWLRVAVPLGPDGADLVDDAALAAWVAIGTGYAESLPPT